MENTYELNGKTLKIVQDDNSGESPREWDGNISTLVIFGSYSHLGDKHNFVLDGNSEDEDTAIIERDKNVVHVQPIYGYSHSGLTISLSPFSCPWDSGVMGFLVITKDKIRECYGVKRVTKKLIAKAIESAKGEIETLDQYITGDIYGFEITDEDDNHVDSCYGFYGSDINTNGILDYIDDEWKKVINN